MTIKTTDVLLVGAGAMSTTLGVMLKQLDPSLKIAMVDRLDSVASESTDGMNNAGTGHAAYCELNYTPMQPDGSINASKAFSINAAFETSLQLWSYLIEQKALPENPREFINQVPHQSFVWGDENVNFLRKRYEALSNHHQFSDMEYSENPEQIRKWLPLVMQNRHSTDNIAATRMRYGSDVNYGVLARNMAQYLETQDDFELLLCHEVKEFYQQPDSRWQVTLKNNLTGDTVRYDSKFVFLGAGGAALSMLQKTGLPECEGYGGFPVSGQWLVCHKPEIADKHLAKVYGAAPVGAPPMSVPHLDTRIINGKKNLLFGPFAGFTTKFLKQGSMFDMPLSVNLSNLKPMLAVGIKNTDLISYLVSEVMQPLSSRIDSLRDFFPDAQAEDWELASAGQRVQIIKKNAQGEGKLEFGTEVVTASDGTLAALLGASPGASTAVSAMVQVLEKCFGEQVQSSWADKLRTMIPTYGLNITEDADLLHRTRERTLRVLGLDSAD